MSLDVVAASLGCVAGLLVGATLGYLLGRRARATVDAVVEGLAADASAAPVVPEVCTVGGGDEDPAAVAFDAAVEGAIAMGWSPRLVAGADLARMLDDGDEGARRFALALEASARRGISTLDDVFARQLALARVWEGAAALAASRGLELIVEPPRAVGPRHQERWLIDEEQARRLGTGRPGGFVQPVLVLRPALVRDGGVLLEGVVV